MGIFIFHGACLLATPVDSNLVARLEGDLYTYIYRDWSRSLAIMDSLAELYRADQAWHDVAGLWLWEINGAEYHLDWITMQRSLHKLDRLIEQHHSELKQQYSNASARADHDFYQGLYYSHIKHYPAALRHFRRCLDRLRAAPELSHVDSITLVTTYQHLVRVHFKLGHDQAAALLLRQGKEKATYGGQLAIFNRQEGDLLRKAGDRPGAEQAYRRALAFHWARYEESESFNGPAWVQVCKRLVELMAHQERWDRAQQYLTKGLDKLQPQDARYHDLLMVQAHLSIQQGKFQAGKQQLRHAQQLRREYFGAGSAQVAEAYQALGQLAQVQGQPDSALAYFQQADRKSVV